MKVIEVITFSRRDFKKPYRNGKRIGTWEEKLPRKLFNLLLTPGKHFMYLNCDPPFVERTGRRIKRLTI